VPRRGDYRHATPQRRYRDKKQRSQEYVLGSN
jgi:hypothetical protein